MHTGQKLSTLLPPLIGRIRLSEIAEEWSLTHALNPRLLAQEVAGVLRTIAPEDRVLESQHYSLAMFDLSSGAGDITYSAIADFFESLSHESSAPNILTSVGLVPAGTVLLTRTFIGRIASEATTRAACAAGFSAATLPPPSPTIGGSAARQSLQPERPNSSSEEVLSAHQERQRIAGEISARQLLEIAQLAQQKAEQAAEKAQARADDALRQLTALHEENATLRQEQKETQRLLNAARDDACELEAQLEQHALYAQFLSESNPLSPPEIRLAFQCWRELTKDGQHNPAGTGGRGVHRLVNEWAKKQGLSLNKEQMARLRACVNWHKERGAIRTK